MTNTDKELQTYLESFLTPHRIQRLKEVLAQRTRYIICVLEDLYDPRNGSAVIRHCDALGIQEIHAIEHKNRFRTDHQVDMGTAQWLDIQTSRSWQGLAKSVKERRKAKDHSLEAHSGTIQALTALKQRGYRIAAAVPQAENAETPESINLSESPLALVFGSEKHGISAEVRTLADSFISIPMSGFIDSFNISASAAIILYTLVNRLKKENLPWQLNSEDAENTYFRWVKASAPHVDKLTAHYQSVLADGVRNR
ncbi:MAG: hypothetical protein B0D92_05265 [Spirochaeta sp. LUC14_002_19_P3]|nr:MAG: hypothetical protein B0D92_05265 [Spirochaeta sp. LUC14_002_19_P3]